MFTLRTFAAPSLCALLVVSCSGGGSGSTTANSNQNGAGPTGPGTPITGPDGRTTGLKFPTKGANPAAMNAVLSYRNLKFDKPVFLCYPPDGSNRVVVAELAGKLKIFPNSDATTSTGVKTFLDITSKVKLDNEAGVLGMAFHPNYKTNGYVFVQYCFADSSGNLNSRLSRFTVSTTSADQLDPKSETVLIEVAQLDSLHNAAMLAFGPDGKLYAGYGDGGTKQFANAQNTGTLLGSILRIDVDRKDTGKNYAVPTDNPFVKTSGALGEIWAYGLRNPYRFSFDRNLGTLWCGDVGEATREEIDVIVKGGNYGWSEMEGTYNIGLYNKPPNWTSIPPVYEYAQTVGGKCIIGGYVYRGTKLPELYGAYLYGDYTAGNVWALVMDQGKVKSNTLLASVTNLASFGEDEKGEVHMVSHNGYIYTLTRKTTGDPPFPAKLSETGLFQDTAKLITNEHLLPYDVAEPLWSDDAVKQRWLAIPASQNIVFSATGAWTFPVGSVFVKHFELPTTAGDPSKTTRLETRVMLNTPSGYQGFCYKWNSQQTDAELLTGGETQKYTVLDAGAPNGKREQTWEFPARTACLSCHTAAAGHVLGPRTFQMNLRVRYTQPPRIANQLTVMDELGLFATSPGSTSQYGQHTTSRDPFGGTLEARVRSYLDVNCAFCHQPGGPGRGSLDLRVTTSLANTGVYKATPTISDLGLTNAMIVAPGSKASSVLWERLRRLDGNRMPPIGTHLVDEPAVDLIGTWIDQLK